MSLVVQTWFKHTVYWQHIKIEQEKMFVKTKTNLILFEDDTEVKN